MTNFPTKMGEEDEKEQSFSSLKLPLLHIPLATMDSPERPSGLSTPPLQTFASVPFKWEEQPGKPRPCSDIIPLLEPVKGLELPPCRMEPATKLNKTSSPTTVLDDPYNVGRPKFSSFRFFREGHDSFDSCSSGSPDGVFLGSKKKGFFGKFRGGRKEFDGGSSRFSASSICSSDSDESCTKLKDSDGGKMRRNGRFYSVSHARPSHLLTTIYEGLKQVVQWKSSRKSNKDGRD